MSLLVGTVHPSSDHWHHQTLTISKRALRTQLSQPGESRKHQQFRVPPTTDPRFLLVSHSQVVLSSSQQVAAADQPTAHLTLDPSDQPPAKQAHPLTGVLYDALLPIDVSDDAEPLLLGLNKGDDPLDVTKRFIDDNNLPQTYHDEIVAFINMVGPK